MTNWASFAYTGSNTSVAALTPSDIAEIEINYPAQNTLNQDQFDRWLEQSWLLRHINDNIGDDPFG